MASREWNIVRGAVRDLSTLEASIANMTAPDDEFGAQLVVWYRQIRAMRRALAAAITVIDKHNAAFNVAVRYDSAAGEP